MGRPTNLFGHFLLHAHLPLFLLAAAVAHFFVFAVFTFGDAVAQCGAAQGFIFGFLGGFLIRIFAHVVLNPQRRALQVEGFAEGLREVAGVAVGHMLQRIAVNHDHGRVHAALVGIAHFRAYQAGAGGAGV